MSGRAILAWNLRTLRNARDLSQERLAAEAGVDRAWVVDIELQNGSASVDVVDRLAAALQVPIGALFAAVPPGAPMPPTLRGGRPRKGD